MLCNNIKGLNKSIRNFFVLSSVSEKTNMQNVKRLEIRFFYNKYEAAAFQYCHVNKQKRNEI
jgi:hypothetical protein